MALDTMDFWVGSVLILTLALVQSLLYGWGLGIEKGEIEHLENIIAEIKIEEPRPKVGKWIQLTYENIVNLDLPARSGIDRGELERRADQAVRRSEIIHIWVED